MQVRFAAVIALVVVVAIGLVAAFVLLQDADPDGPALPAPAPRVLKAKHAADAVEGDDYEVVGELAAVDGSAAQVVLPDGRVVVTVTRAGSFGAEDYVLALVDSESGEREQLPAPWLGLGEVYPSATLLDDDRLMVTWSFRERGEPRSKVMMVDLASGTREQFDVPVPPLPDGVKVLSSPQPASDGRLWFQTGNELCGDGECSAPRQGVLWSFAPGDDRPRREQAAVWFALGGDLLAWTESNNNDTIHVRDLESGDEHEYVVDGRCVIGGLVASNELAAAVCKFDYGRQVAVDAEGRLIADFRLSYEYPAVGDRWILISPFAYDTETGRLLRFFSRQGADFTRPLNGDLTVLPIGQTKDDPAVDRWTVLRLRDAR